jgi:hypothetical protein
LMSLLMYFTEKSTQEETPKIRGTTRDVRGE